jgi:hypothetical protein
MSSQFPDAENILRRRLSAQNLLDTGSPYEEFSASQALPKATELLYTYDDAFVDETDGEDEEREGEEGYNPSGRPAPLTVIPTTTSNPDRPRTLAAGYDYPHRTMTVLFRDGVLFNFYAVDMREWQSFKSAFSKGVWLEANKPSRMGGGGSWAGEKVTGGQADALADAIATQARALQQFRVGRQRFTIGTEDQAKVSGYRRAVLKYVDRGRGMSTTAAHARAKAELAFYRKKR